MRGISFKVPNIYSNILNLILEGINIEDYYWKIDEDQVLLDGGGFLFSDESFDGNDIISKSKLKNLIASETYLCWFIKLKGFRNVESIVPIENYEDFLKSGCEFLLSVVDGEFVEIYAKENGVIDIVKNNCEKNGFTNVRVIADKNDIRKSFIDF